jgi:pimeloyl-ACP methyl ester carboxylesterase
VFEEGSVEADGFRIRYMAAGEGPALVHLHGAGGLRLGPTHDLLARRFRVVAFEMPGFGRSPENTRTRDMAELARTMAQAAAALGLDRFNLWGTSFGGKVALWLAAQQPERLLALVLDAPAAIRSDASRPPSGSPGEIARLLYAHPERVTTTPPDPEEMARARPLVMRLIGPPRDAALEAEMRRLTMPTLTVFGTEDRVIAPEFGRLYKELIPGSHLVFVYDAGHAIGAERPEAFAEVVADFIERREGFVINRAATGIHP